MDPPNSSKVKPLPNRSTSHPSLTGASTKALPGPGPLDQSASASGVSRDDPSCEVGTDSRPLLINARAKGKSRARERVASRKIREAGNLGVMKSVLRVELRMFSRAA